jgi:hypothetical protein
MDTLHGCEIIPLEAHFQSKKQPKVTQSKIRRIRWFGGDRNVFRSVQLLHNKRCEDRWDDAAVPAPCRAASSELY